MKKFVLVHGLPGSGKTTLLKKLVNEKLSNRKEAEYMDVDIAPFDSKQLRSKLRELRMFINYDNNHNDDRWYNYNPEKAVVYVDALCLTNKDLADLIYELICQYNTLVYDKSFKFTILDFEDNRELCIKNDIIRSFANPSRSAKLTIENSIFESVDCETIINTVRDKLVSKSNSNYTITVDTKKIPVWNSDEASSYERTKAFVYSAAPNFGTVVKNVLRGESWTVSGREWSYTGKEWSVGGQEPNDFEGFDNLIETLYPEIPFLKYKKIRKECCNIEEYDEHDYYSSYTKNRWVCDLDKLVSILVELEILN